MTFPPPPALAPRQHAGWTELLSRCADGEWHAVADAQKALIEGGDLRESSARAMLKNAQKTGWLEFKPDAELTWVIKLHPDACRWCESPRTPQKPQDALKPAEAADDTEAGALVRLREAVGRDGWLNAIAIAGIVAALGPIEPEELAVAVREFKVMSDAEMGSAMELLTDRLALVELSTKLDPKLIYYVMAD